MRFIYSLIVIAFAGFAAVCRAGPVPSMTARSQFCANAPTVKAGTLWDRRDLLSTRVDPNPPRGPVVVCVPNSQVYVVITIGIQLGGETVKNLLENAALYILNIIMKHGDGVLHNGMFNFPGMNHATLQAWNANNHQTTYGVLGGALSALHDWMSNHAFTSASFGIFDGINQVGNGVINGAP